MYVRFISLFGVFEALCVFVVSNLNVLLIFNILIYCGQGQSAVQIDEVYLSENINVSNR